MRRTKKQKALDEELYRECEGYYEDDDKPDGAYIEEYGIFFNLNKIKRLIEKGADVRAKGEWGSTPLHLAVDWDRIELAKLLIDSGADVDAKGLYGSTPLHLAVLWDRIEIAKLLIDSGADVGAKDEDRRTPLHLPKSEEMEALLRKDVAIT